MVDPKQDDMAFFRSPKLVHTQGVRASSLQWRVESCTKASLVRAYFAIFENQLEMSKKYSQEAVDICTNDQKFLQRALQYCQNESTDPSKRGWYYIDTKGNVRGPYTPAKMRKWFCGGHFPSDLMVRWGDNGIYTDIASLGANAFLIDERNAFADALESVERLLVALDLPMS